MITREQAIETYGVHYKVPVSSFVNKNTLKVFEVLGERPSPTKSEDGYTKSLIFSCVEDIEDYMRHKQYVMDLCKLHEKVPSQFELKTKKFFRSALQNLTGINYSLDLIPSKASKLKATLGKNIAKMALSHGSLNSASGGADVPDQSKWAEGQVLSDYLFVQGRLIQNQEEIAKAVAFGKSFSRRLCDENDPKFLKYISSGLHSLCGATNIKMPCLETQALDVDIQVHRLSDTFDLPEQRAGVVHVIVEKESQAPTNELTYQAMVYDLKSVAPDGSRYWAGGECCCRVDAIDHWPEVLKEEDISSIPVKYINGSLETSKSNIKIFSDAAGARAYVQKLKDEAVKSFDGVLGALPQGLQSGLNDKKEASLKLVNQ